MMKKLIKAGVLLIIFVAALIVSSLVINRGSGDQIVDMGAPTLPRVWFTLNGEKVNVEAEGNGRLDAVSNALSEHFKHPCDICCYEEHTLNNKGSESSAIAYVGITGDNGKEYFGIGVDHDIIRASIDALESAMNRSLEKAE